MVAMRATCPKESRMYSCEQVPPSSICSHLIISKVRPGVIAQSACAIPAKDWLMHHAAMASNASQSHGFKQFSSSMMTAFAL